jgi:hypothetical protein
MLGLMVVLCATVLGWRLAGGKMLMMQTPSMCPRICVGALVADRPLTGPLHTGEIITFYPPGDTTETYSHEVWHIFPTGQIQTKGIANSYHDPWVLVRPDIIGRVAFTIPAAGWLLKVLPFLAAGVLIWVLSRPFISRRVCRAWDRAWIAVMVIVPVAAFHPLINAAVIGSSGHPLRAKVANSGLLPEALHNGGHTLARHVAPAHIAHVTVHGKAPWPPLLETASLAWWGWALVGLGCGWPLLAYLWHICRGDETPAPRPATDSRSPGAISQ